MRSDGSEIPGAGHYGHQSDMARYSPVCCATLTARKQADETRARWPHCRLVGRRRLQQGPGCSIRTWNAWAERLFGTRRAKRIGGIEPDRSAGKSVELAAMLEKADAARPVRHSNTSHHRKTVAVVDISITTRPHRSDRACDCVSLTIARDTQAEESRGRTTRLNEEIQLQRLRIFRATMRDCAGYPQQFSQQSAAR